MIRRVYSLDKGLLLDCRCIVNCFMDADTLGEWTALKYQVDSGKTVMLVDEKENGFLKGFLFGNLDVECAILKHLFIDKRFHRSGVGSALVKAYEEYARRAGVKRIKLQSRPTRQAISFYQKHGFQKINWGNYMQKSL